MSPGMVASMACSCWPPAMETESLERSSGRAERAEGELAVVASADRFADGGGAACLESGEEQSGFDLGAGDGRGVVDGGKGCAVDRDGRVAFGEFDARAHLRERLADAFHGAAAERGVADEGEAARLRCDQARQHAHGRAGVAAVEGMVRGGEVAGGSGDFDCVVRPRNLGAEGGDTGEGGGTVGAGGEIGKARGPVGESAQQCVTVADTFVAGQAKAALDIAGGLDDALGGNSGQSTLRELESVLSYWSDQWSVISDR